MQSPTAASPLSGLPPLVGLRLVVCLVRPRAGVRPCSDARRVRLPRRLVRRSPRHRRVRRPGGARSGHHRPRSRACVPRRRRRPRSPTVRGSDCRRRLHRHVRRDASLLRSRCGRLLPPAMPHRRDRPAHARDLSPHARANGFERREADLPAVLRVGDIEIDRATQPVRKNGIAVAAVAHRVPPARDARRAPRRGHPLEGAHRPRLGQPVRGRNALPAALHPLPSPEARRRAEQPPSTSSTAGAPATPSRAPAAPARPALC